MHTCLWVCWCEGECVHALGREASADQPRQCQSCHGLQESSTLYKGQKFPQNSEGWARAPAPSPSLT